MFFSGNGILALPVGRPAGGHRGHGPALDGHWNLLSCRNGRPDHSSAFAKRLRQVVLLPPVRVSYIGNV